MHCRIPLAQPEQHLYLVNFQTNKRERRHRPIARNTIHERCFPLEPMRAIKKWIKKVRAMICAITTRLIVSSVKWIVIAANPNQAMVVICQANLNVLIVKSWLPKILGKSSRRNNRMRIYFSPRYEWAIPMKTSSAAAIKRKISKSFFPLAMVER